MFVKINDYYLNTNHIIKITRVANIVTLHTNKMPVKVLLEGKTEKTIEKNYKEFIKQLNDVM